MRAPTYLPLEIPQPLATVRGKSEIVFAGVLAFFAGLAAGLLAAAYLKSKAR